jgi:outer membrane biosynthesis protein TonB
LSPAESSPTAFRRWLDAFVALPDRIKLPLAVFLALLLHGLVILLAWVWPFFVQLLVRFSLLPAPIPEARTTPTPEPKRLEVTLFTPTPVPKIAAKPTPTPEKLPERDEQLLKELFAQLPPEKQREYVDVEGLARKKNTSAKALLESWRDSIAGSRKRGTGSDPLPTLDGLENMPFQQMTDREVSLGKPENPAKAAVREKTGAVPAPPAAQNNMPPLFEPKPVDTRAQTSNTATQTAEPAPPSPTPTPTPQPMLVAKATPPPNLLSVQEANAEQIPIFLNRRSDPTLPKNMATLRPEPEAKPTPLPTATPPPKPTPITTIHPSPTQLPTPTPQDMPPKAPTQPQSVIVAAKLDLRTNQPHPVPNPGYSPQMRRTKINGMNMPEGVEGVDSVATPLGRFKKDVSNAVGSRWNYYIQEKMGVLQTGKVSAAIVLDARGKLLSVRITENTSNWTHAALVERAIREAEFSKPPPESLKNGRYEDVLGFILVPAH